MILVCKHCGYEWDYGGKGDFYACCPRCRWLIRLEAKDGQ